MASNAYVGVAPDSTGKKVRSLEVTILAGDGSVQTLEMQVISIADRTGGVLDFANLEGNLERINDTLAEILLVLQIQNELDPEE